MQRKKLLSCLSPCHWGLGLGRVVALLIALHSMMLGPDCRGCVLMSAQGQSSLDHLLPEVVFHLALLT